MPNESRLDESRFDYCERCGGAAAGTYKLMFYHSLFRLPAREFYCYRCLKVMKVYAIIGFSLLGITVGALCVVTWRLVGGP